MKRPVAVIGLGFMGSALARALACAGFNVCAWSRSAARRAEFSNELYVPASAVDAVKASDVIVLCITNFDASAAFLELAGLAEALRGKTLLQLTSEFSRGSSAFRDLGRAVGCGRPGWRDRHHAGKHR